MVKSQRQHLVPVPCGLGFCIIHHNKVVGIVSYKFRSTNVHRFIFGSRDLEIGALCMLLTQNAQEFHDQSCGDLRELGFQR